MTVEDRELSEGNARCANSAPTDCAAALDTLANAAPAGLRDICLGNCTADRNAARAAQENGRWCLRDADGRLMARATPWRATQPALTTFAPGETLATEAFIDWCADIGLGYPAGLDRERAVCLAPEAAQFPVIGTRAELFCAALVSGFGLPKQAERLLDERLPLLPASVGSMWIDLSLPEDAPLWAVATPSAVDEHASPGKFNVSLIDDTAKVWARLEGVHYEPDGLQAELIDIPVAARRDPSALRHDILAKLARNTARVLGRDSAPTDAPLAGLGIDSLMGTALLSDLEAAIGVDLALDRVTPQTTLEQLADLARDAIMSAAVSTSRKRSDFGTWVNPALDERLSLAGVARDYIWGRGHLLRDTEGREVIDCVAQYGALPFGHNPPQIWEAINRLQEAEHPSFMSLSAPPLAGQLAERLVALAPTGIDCAFFCTSGTEAVEAAIKLSRSATRKQGILATKGGFHGLTLGALSATGRAAYHADFGVPLPGFSHISYGDIDALQTYLANHAEETAAFIVEPLQAEGGIVAPPEGYLEAAAALCRRHDVLLIADEVQTGLGRLGTLFASHAAQPDIITLAKALGGGIAPMGAVLYRSPLANDAFLLRHGSTFGSTTLGAVAALATLDRLTDHEDTVLDQVTGNGEAIRAEMERIAAEYSDVVRAVRGRGLLQGMVFATGPSAYTSPVLNLLCQWEAFGIVLASYLLNQHGLRVAPALADGAVLRIEPPLTAPSDIVAPIAAGLRDLADTLSRGDVQRLLTPMLGGAEQMHQPRTARERPAPRLVQTDRRFAFLVHLMGADDLSRFDPGLAGLDLNQFDRARTLLNRDLHPAVICETVVHAPDGRAACGDVILVPHTAREMIEMPRAQALATVSDAISLGAARGAQVVGLGGFNSVVTEGGAALPTSIPLTTGNGLTAVSAVDGIIEGLRAQGRDPASTTVAVIGGFGSVGRGCVLLLADKVARVLIVGRPEPRAAAEARLLSLRQALPQPMPGVVQTLELSLDAVDAIGQAGAVITATNALGALADPSHFQRGAVVSDVSRPFNLPPDLNHARPDLRVIEGGVIAPWGPFDLGIDLGTPPGSTYACMAETMLLALTGAPDRGKLGNHTDLPHLTWISGAAMEAGMRTLLHGPVASNADTIE